MGRAMSIGRFASPGIPSKSASAAHGYPPLRAFPQATPTAREKWIQDIVFCCCEEFSVDPLDFFSERRPQRIVRARHGFVFMARYVPDDHKYTFTELGEYLLRRDHTTIMASLKRARALIAHDVLFRRALKNILSKLRRRGSYSTARRYHREISSILPARRGHWSMSGISYGKGQS